MKSPVGDPKKCLNQQCFKCLKSVDPSDSLHCIDCQQWIHIKCLTRASTPGDFCGDVFFDYTCAKCNATPSSNASTSAAAQDEKPDRFVRQRLPWIMIISLALYNLSAKSKGLGRQGYFHWRSHIVNFIDRNWDNLFDASMRRRKNWIGSVSGNLSSNSPTFFLSGQSVFKEAGWWKSTHSNTTPMGVFTIYKDIVQSRQKQRHGKRAFEDETSAEEVDTAATNEAKRSREIAPEEDVPCSRTIPYMGRKPKPSMRPTAATASKAVAPQPAVPNEELPSWNTVQSGLMDFLAENLADDDLTIFDNLPSISAGPLKAIEDKLLQMNESPKPKKAQSRGDKCLRNLPGGEPDSESNEEKDEECEEHKPRVVQVINFEAIEKEKNKKSEGVIGLIPKNGLSDKLQNNHIKDEPPSEDDESISTEGESNLSEISTTPKLVPGSLFTRVISRPLPWLSDFKGRGGENACNPLKLMSTYEEKELLKKLQKVLTSSDRHQQEVPSHIRRFYRKLVVRQWKREHGKPIFDLDDFVNGKQKASEEVANEEVNIIDRYRLLAGSEQNAAKSFHARIAGSSQYELFKSPYTQRVLHPFVYRDTKIFPNWLKLMCEIQHAADGSIPTRSSIDFCYVRPNHIAAVNALLQNEFWSGIDMTECLGYPDFSVVAQYKKLVVGCGFLVPDVGYNEAYISFMAVRPGWQRHGIGTFMLYHLIQTCMTKDITLHVSATNPAVVLYQKFGFKTEEIILDFYDKYLPVESTHSRHALFLRLMR